MKWVEVFRGNDELQAQMLKGLLESGGITVRLWSLRVGPYPVNVGRMGEVRLLVPEEEAQDALKLLGSARG
jgi:hypothetical protein